MSQCLNSTRTISTGTKKTTKRVARKKGNAVEAAAKYHNSNQRKIKSKLHRLKQNLLLLKKHQMSRKLNRKVKKVNAIRIRARRRRL